MKSFYINEHSVGTELTKLELMADQKSVSNNIPLFKTKGESSSESIPEDLEPISMKLLSFKIESPKLCTPFSEGGSGRRSSPTRRTTDGKEENLLVVQSCKQAEASGYWEKGYTGFSEFVSKIEERRKVKEETRSNKHRLSLKGLEANKVHTRKRKSSYHPPSAIERNQQTSGRPLDPIKTDNKKKHNVPTNFLNVKHIGENHGNRNEPETPCFTVRK